jgi:hypothetical protein
VVLLYLSKKASSQGQYTSHKDARLALHALHSGKCSSIGKTVLIKALGEDAHSLQRSKLIIGVLTQPKKWCHNRNLKIAHLLLWGKKVYIP